MLIDQFSNGQIHLKSTLNMHYLAILSWLVNPVDASISVGPLAPSLHGQAVPPLATSKSNYQCKK